MANTSTLRSLQAAEVCYVLVVDGLTSMWATHEDLEGDPFTTGSWLYPDRTLTSASCTASLLIPKELPLGTDSRTARLDETSTTTFEIVDFNGDVANLFAAERSDVETLLTQIEPNESLSGKATQEGTQLTGTHNIGLELVIDNRRHQNPCVLNFQPGLFHTAPTAAKFAVPVSPLPVIHAGRRVCLYKVFKDIVSFPGESGGYTWRPLSDSDLIWWGTLRDRGTVQTRSWKLSCFGPGSWLRKRVASQAHDALPVVGAAPTLDTDETYYGISFQVAHSPNNTDSNDEPAKEPAQLAVTLSYLASGSFQVVGTDPNTNIPINEFNDTLASTTFEGVRDELDTIITTLKGANQNPEGFLDYFIQEGSASGTLDASSGWENSQPNPTFELTFGGAFKISIEDETQYQWANKPNGPFEFNTGRSYWMARVQLALSRAMWNILGYDPLIQRDLELDETAYLHFDQLGTGQQGFPIREQNGFAIRTADPPTNDYWMATFSTLPLGYNSKTGFIELESDNSTEVTSKRMADIDNGGAYRQFNPLFKGGIFYLDPSKETQEIELNTEDQPVNFGSRWRPVAKEPGTQNTVYNISGIGDVTNTGLYVLQGPFFDGTEQVTETQVVRCSWRTHADGTIAGGANDNPVLVIHEWLNPRDFGIDRDKLTVPWAGKKTPSKTGTTDDQITATPLDIWKVNASAPDDVYKVLARMLISTGDVDVSWDFPEGSFPSPTLTPGLNNLAGFGNATDVYGYDMGLSIPSTMVQTASVWIDQHNKLPASTRQASAYHVDAVDADKVLGSLLDSRAWLWSLDGGKYGVFSLIDPPDPGKATATLTRESLWSPNNVPAEWPEQDIRIYSPIDKVKLDYALEPLKNTTERKLEFISLDKGARYRKSDNVQSLIDWYIPNSPGSLFELQQHWQTATAFWERRHFTTTLKVHRTVGDTLWPGTFVLLTDDRLVSQAGTYGVTSFVGVVLSVVRRPADKHTEIEVLVYAQNANGVRIYAPLGRGVAYDSATKRLYLKDDHLGLGTTTHRDVSFFQAPWWTSYSGSAEITVRQWDRNTWTTLASDVVSSITVSTGTDDSYLTLTTGLANYKRDKDTFVTLTPTNSAQYVTNLYAPISNPSGSQNVKFMDS